MRDKHARRRILILENQVSRWDLSIQAQQDAMLQKFKDGDYVTYADYQKLEAERDALKELNGELIIVLEDIQGMDDSSLWEQNDTVSYIAKFARQAINKAREVMDEM